MANAVAYLLSVSRYLLMTVVIAALDEHKWDKEGMACSAWAMGQEQHDCIKNP